MCVMSLVLLISTTCQDVLNVLVCVVCIPEMTGKVHTRINKDHVNSKFHGSSNSLLCLCCLTLATFSFSFLIPLFSLCFPREIIMDICQRFLFLRGYHEKSSCLTPKISSSVLLLRRKQLPLSLMITVFFLGREL